LTEGLFEVEEACRVCGSEDLLPVLDLGAQPPANSLRSDPSEEQVDVPLELVFCGSCRVPQLTVTVDPAALFSQYVWVTGTARATHDYSAVFRDRIVATMGSDSDAEPFLVEVASNDGTFLRRFQEVGWRVLGVDPAQNIVDEAVAAGVPTRCDFFDLGVAAAVEADHGRADVLVARNVIPHVKAIHSILEGVVAMLHDDGVAAIEFHSASRIVEELHYDSIYHEHLFYFSLSTLSALCRRYGLQAFDVFDSPISGGSRVLLLSADGRPEAAALSEALAGEVEMGITDYETWRAFGEGSRRHASRLAEVVGEQADRVPVIGYGASARSSTMLNFAGIDVGRVSAVIDQNPGKQGQYTPGTNIPIVDRDEGLRMLGDDGVVLLLAWNFAEEILEGLRADGIRCEVVVPLPGDVRSIRGEDPWRS